MTIQAVLFDLDETLLDRTGSLVEFLPDQYRRFRDRLGEVDPATWAKHFLALDKRGMIPKSVVYPRLLLAFDGDPSAADVLHADYQKRLSDHVIPNAGMAEALSRLRKAGLKLAIVTNGEAESQKRNMRALGLTGLVDVVLISEEEGARKPDRAIFLRAAQRLGISPADCLFVGDNPVADVLGAHACGMRTAWFSTKSKWPGGLPPRPGAIISTLDEVLPLVFDRQQSALNASNTAAT